MQDQQRKIKGRTRHQNSQEIADLHLGRSAAEDVADLEVLQHLARNRR